uniref:Vps16_N domain-containing protein n=1 Tax=Mesocestoides corti TaxID=53468 RepID=A0A5K3ESW0_MESCO
MSIILKEKLSQSGMRLDAFDEYQNYQDSARRVKPVCLTWTEEGYAVFGCKSGHIFMVDLYTMSIGVVYNPGLHVEQTALSNYPVDFIRLQAGDVNDLAYIKYGIICGGVDGRVRLLDWRDVKLEDLPFGMVAPSSHSARNISSNFISTVRRIASSKMSFMDDDLNEALETQYRGIVHMSVCASFDKLSILRQSGMVQICQQVTKQAGSDSKPDFEVKSLKLIRNVQTTVSNFTGICSISIEEESFFVTCNVIGQLALWFARNGHQASCLEFPS